MDEELARENLRLARRVKRLESTLEQVEGIRDGNAQLLNRVMSELDAERARSRELLLNVLPASIVSRLDAGETHIADAHAEVAVLMADLVGFTAVRCGSRRPNSSTTSTTCSPSSTKPASDTASRRSRRLAMPTWRSPGLTRQHHRRSRPRRRPWPRNARHHRQLRPWLADAGRPSRRPDRGRHHW